MGEHGVGSTSPNTIAAPAGVVAAPSPTTVAKRAGGTAVATALFVAAVQPQTLQAIEWVARSVRAALPSFAVLAALALTALGRRMALMSRWPLGLVRFVIVLGWALAGSVVLRRAVTSVDADFFVTIVDAFGGPTRSVLGV